MDAAFSRQMLDAVKQFGRVQARELSKTRQRSLPPKRNVVLRQATQVSLGLSCHPSQAKEFNEHARRAGLTNVHYDEKTGDCHVPCFGEQRKKLLKLREYVDRGAV